MVVDTDRTCVRSAAGCPVANRWASGDSVHFYLDTGAGIYLNPLSGSPISEVICGHVALRYCRLGGSRLDSIELR